MANSTQTFVPIQEIRERIVILKDGGIRAVLMTSSINLFLKSDDEQQATILQFQDFLNSLDFSTQILVQSRKRDMTNYLNLLEERIQLQTEELLRLQTREYINYIRTFTERVNVMEKLFYIIVPYGSISVSNTKNKKSFFDSFLPTSTKKKGSTGKSESKAFTEARTQLEQRITIIQQGLGSIGIRAQQLNTDELIELYYSSFNPGETTSHMTSQEN